MNYTKTLLALAAIVLSGCVTNPAKTYGGGRFLQMRVGESTLIGQLDYPDASLCSASMGSYDPSGSVKMTCATESRGTELPYKASVMNTLMGVEMPVHFRVKVQCESEAKQSPANVKFTCP